MLVMKATPKEIGARALQSQCGYATACHALLLMMKTKRSLIHSLSLFMALFLVSAWAGLSLSDKTIQ